MSDLKDGFYWVKYKDMEPVIFQKEGESWYAFGIETEADITGYEILGEVSEWSSDESSGLHLADVTVRFIDFLPPSMIKNEKENGALYVGLIADAPKKYRHLLINSENNRYCVLNAR